MFRYCASSSSKGSYLPRKGERKMASRLERPSRCLRELFKHWGEDEMFKRNEQDGAASRTVSHSSRRKMLRKTGGGFCRFITPYTGQIAYLWVKAVKNLISSITCYFEENHDTDEMSRNMNIYFTLNIILSFRDIIPRKHTDKYTWTFLIPFASCAQVLSLYL